MHALEAHRRALAAVAKLTIFAGAIGAGGCAGTVIVETEEVPADLDPGDADPSDPPDVIIDPPKPETACFDGAANVDACCSTLLTSSFSDDHLFSDPSSATDEEKACCDLVLDTLDTWASADPAPFEWGLGSSCCSTGLFGDWTDHPTCTPWGPPMPPAMPRRFARTAVLA
jgi:hypothetical protein